MRMIIDVKSSEHTKGLKELLKKQNVKITGLFKWLCENEDELIKICNKIPQDINYRWKKDLKEEE